MRQGGYKKIHDIQGEQNFAAFLFVKKNTKTDCEYFCKKQSVKNAHCIKVKKQKIVYLKVNSFFMNSMQGKYSIQNLLDYKDDNQPHDASFIVKVPLGDSLTVLIIK